MRTFKMNLPPMTLATMAALTACTDWEVDTSIDRYLERRASPSAMVDGDGNYVGGWWESWEGRINPEDASGPDGQLQGWIHWSFDSERYLVIANLVDLNSASNTALLVVDKQEERFVNRSLKYTFGDNVIERDKASSAITNPADGSWATVDDDDVLEFDVAADGVALSGRAVPALGDPFVQTTRSIDGYGWLQWYVNMEVEQATLTLDGEDIELEPGALGVMDRMVGHRMNVQSWNWLSLVGPATDPETGATATISVQLAKDQEQARPPVASLKYTVWVDDLLVKVPDVTFDYRITDADTRDTSDWSVSTEDRSGDWVDLTFSPRFHRRDQSDWAWFLHTDFNQYYGEVSGQVHVDGVTWELEEVFAVGEDSLLKL